MQALGTGKEHTNNSILALHAQNCILADTLFNLMNNPLDIYTPINCSCSQSSILLLILLSPIRSPQECISLKETAATPRPLLPSSSSNKPIEPSASSPRLPSPRPLSPARPSYAAVAAQSPSALRTPTPKPRRPPFSKPPSPRSPHPTTAATNSARVTPPHHSSPPSSSPILSIHNLERRFHNRSSPIQDQYNQQSQKPPTATIAQFLHAVADLLGSCDANLTLKSCHSFALD